MRKQSIIKSAHDFSAEADEVLVFAQNCEDALSEKEVSWAYEGAIIRLYRAFENLMLDAIVGAINNDSATLSSTTGVTFPKHLNRDVCEYIVIGSGYFDFKGRDGLIKALKQFVPANRYILDTVKKPTYQDSLEKLSALRNYAAHGSSQSKGVALSATGQKKISSAGSWLKRQSRLESVVKDHKRLAGEIEDSAPY